MMKSELIRSHNGVATNNSKVYNSQCNYTKQSRIKNKKILGQLIIIRLRKDN